MVSIHDLWVPSCDDLRDRGLEQLEPGGHLSLPHKLGASSQHGHLRVVGVLPWGNSKRSRREGGSYKASDDLA